MSTDARRGHAAIAEITPQEISNSSVQDDTDVMSVDEARAVTNSIRQMWALTSISVTKAIAGRAWVALGYDSWNAYRIGEDLFPQLRLDREQRIELVISLNDAGLSKHAIATVTGIARNTVKADLNTQVGQIDPPPAENSEAAGDEKEDSDDEIVDAEIIETSDATTTVTGIDGKTYTVTKPNNDVILALKRHESLKGNRHIRNNRIIEGIVNTAFVAGEVERMIVWDALDVEQLTKVIDATKDAMAYHRRIQQVARKELDRRRS